MKTIPQDTPPDNTDNKARESASDLCAAINAIILESGFDDATRAGLMAAMDAASGRTLPFPMADQYLGRRITRHSSVAVEHDDGVGDRAHAARWQRVWKLIDAEQARTGYRFVERRRGGLRGESRETMKRYASTYTVPIVQITVDVIRRARSYRSRFGLQRIEMFQQAAREILKDCPQDYQREGDPMPSEKRGRAGGETSERGATATRIYKAHQRIVERAAGLVSSEMDSLGACLTLLQNLKDTFGTRFDEALWSFVEPSGEAPACTSSLAVGGTCQDEPEFPPFEPSDDAPESRLEPSGAGEAHAPELFSKPNVYAAENESYVTRTCIVASDNETEFDAVEAAERAAIQAAGCEVSEASEAVPIGDTQPAMPSEKRTVATEALHYASVLGWRVFPLHTPIDEGVCSCGKADCQSIGKHPRTPRGLKDATNDPEQIKRWWQRWPDANIGIATGAASGLLVIDVDPRHGGWQGLEELFKRTGEVFPPTVEVITGSDGGHFYFRMPDADIRNSTGKLGAGLDVRANGGYVVAAFSLHASGNRYRWKNEESPFADVPYKLLKELIAKPRIVRGASNTATTHKWTGGAIPDGSRNKTLFQQVACSMRARGAGEQEILDALIDANRRCSPPLTSDHLEDMARRVVTTYEPNARCIFA
jgi:hypothetical protein